MKEELKEMGKTILMEALRIAVFAVAAAFVEAVSSRLGGEA